MSTTVSYKGNTIATVENNTKTLKTAGKYLEADVILTDVTSGGGGGGESAQKKQINFIDYDGTILHSYTSSEWASVTALPSNPSHTGLTAQGWNWTKAQIDAQLTAMPTGDIWVGQMYITSSGDTEIYVSFVDSARLSPILAICVNGTATVDWGDNTTPDTVTGTSITSRKNISHTYGTTGDYKITIHVVSGSFGFNCTNTITLLRKSDADTSQNRVYSNCIKRIRLGSGITSLGTYSFAGCYSLESVTVPNGVTSVGAGIFYYCLSLASVTFPSGVTSFGNNLFSYCYPINSVSIPSGVTSLGSSTFNYCHDIKSVTIPNGVTSIGNNTFSYCYSLESVTLPSGVTSIGTNAFSYCYSLKSVNIPSGVTSLGLSTFANCQSLASLTVPSGVTDFGNGVFSSCSGMAEYHIKPTTPPTSGTNVFNSIPSDCIIYVPSASLSNYQTATNLSTYASYMQGE